jgi:hypothetical protein
MEDKSVYCVDVHDKEGNLTKIEAYEFGSGEFVIQFLWDEHDEQTSEKRIEFRNWISRHLKQTGYNLMGEN